MKNFLVLFSLLIIISCGSKVTIEDEIIEDIEIDKGDGNDDNGTGNSGSTEPNSDYPLSDQTNVGNWVLNTEVSDEFDSGTLDEDKWHIQGKNGVYQSNFIGRAPSQFSINNAIVEDEKLKILTKY